MSRIEVDHLFTEVPDDEDHKAKGLQGTMTFNVMWQSHASILPVPAGQFSLVPMPGCCGVVVSTDSFLNSEYRGSVGKRFHKLKADVARHFGYKTMLMTTHLRNIPEVVGASQARWKFFHYFRNDRTGNDIGIAVKVL